MERAAGTSPCEGVHVCERERMSKGRSECVYVCEGEGGCIRKGVVRRNVVCVCGEYMYVCYGKEV